MLAASSALKIQVKTATYSNKLVIQLKNILASITLGHTMVSKALCISLNRIHEKYLKLMQNHSHAITSLI